jgi:hypothetical protein
MLDFNANRTGFDLTDQQMRLICDRGLRRASSTSSPCTVGYGRERRLANAECAPFEVHTTRLSLFRLNFRSPTRPRTESSYQLPREFQPA